jgi:hypothetical protein
VVLAPVVAPHPRQLLFAENVSSGGVFVTDPAPSLAVDDTARLRFPGLPEVPELSVRIRWIRAQGHPGFALGYGCMFENVSSVVVRRLLSSAAAPRRAKATLVVPPELYETPS